MKTKQYVLDSELKKDRTGLVELSYVYITRGGFTIEFSEMRGPNKIFGSFISQNEPNILFGPLISENSIITPPLNCTF